MAPLMLCLSLSLIKILMTSPPGGIWRPPDTTFVADGFGVSNVDFIPEALLDNGEWKKLKLHPMTAGFIQHAIEYSRNRIAEGKSPCTLGVMGSLPAGEGQPLPEGLEALKTAPVIFVGTVEHLVHGLDAEGDAATLVKIRVTKTLRNDFAVHVGSRATLVDPIGKTTVDGVELCTEKQGYRLPEQGEEVVVGGELDPVNPGKLFADQHLVFFVHDGIVNRGAQEPEDWRPISLTDLDRQLNPKKSR